MTLTQGSPSVCKLVHRPICMISSSSDSELRPSGVSRNLAPEPQSLSAEISPSPRPERRAGGGGWAAAVSIINLKFSAASAASAVAGEEIERTKQLEMAHCPHHCREGRKKCCDCVILEGRSRNLGLILLSTAPWLYGSNHQGEGRGRAESGMVREGG